MKRNTIEWLRAAAGGAQRMAMPVMTYPALGLTGMDLMSMLGHGENQAACMRTLAERYPSAAAMTVMDLSVEAEAFGSKVRFSRDEVPTVTGSIVTGAEDAEKLAVPQVGTGRTGEYVKAVRLACGQITDRPVLGGMIGPLSLAGRLIGVSEIMLAMMDEPETVHAVLRKSTAFLCAYAEAFRGAGADGLLIAEPVAGVVSPAFGDTFSSRYVKEIVDAVQGENFAVILHNCGKTVKLVPSMVSTGAMGFHFGNAVRMAEIMPQLPGDRVAFGNIDPAGVFRMGTPALMKRKVAELLGEMRPYGNFILSSGCDVPPGTPLENIDAFFEALAAFNAGR